MDNLRMHYNHDIRDVFDQYGYERVFAPAYASVWNPAERIFALSKKTFRTKCLLLADYAN